MVAPLISAARALLLTRRQSASVWQSTVCDVHPSRSSPPCRERDSVRWGMRVTQRHLPLGFSCDTILIARLAEVAESRRYSLHVARMLQNFIQDSRYMAVMRQHLPPSRFFFHALREVCSRDAFPCVLRAHVVRCILRETCGARSQRGSETATYCVRADCLASSAFSGSVCYFTITTH